MQAYPPTYTCVRTQIVWLENGGDGDFQVASIHAISSSDSEAIAIGTHSLWVHAISCTYIYICSNACSNGYVYVYVYSRNAYMHPLLMDVCWFVCMCVGSACMPAC